MAYKGDSPGKAVTRYKLWSNMATTSTALGIHYTGAYVLGGEGGDISVLSSLGIEHNSITAVDYNKGTADLLSKKYPEVTVLHGEAGKSASKVKFNAAHLDFCGKLSTSNIITLVDVMDAIEKPGCVMITMLKGRESTKSGLKSLLWGGVHRSARRGLLAAIRKGKEFTGKHSKELAEHILSNKDGEYVNPKYILSIFYKRYKDVFGNCLTLGAPEYETNNFLKDEETIGPLGLGMCRLDAMRECADILLVLRDYQRQRTDKNYRGFKSSYMTQISSFITYHSKTKEDHGTPFTSGLIFITPVRMHYDLLQNDKVMGPHMIAAHYDAKTSMEQLKAVVCGLKDLPTKQVSEMFKIKQGTVAAWRAHKTMGTYENSTVNPVIRMTTTRVSDLYGYYTGWGNVVFDTTTNRTALLLEK